MGPLGVIHTEEHGVGGSLSSPRKCEVNDWAASSTPYYNFLHSHCPSQEPCKLLTPLPVFQVFVPPQVPIMNPPQVLTMNWVWQICPTKQGLPAYCSSCNNWGTMAMVQLG